MRYYGSDRRPRKDTLQHWKYIKREKVGGKWKYYYDWDELKSDAGKAVNTAADKVSGAARSVANKASDVKEHVTGSNARFERNFTRNHAKVANASQMHRAITNRNSIDKGKVPYGTTRKQQLATAKAQSALRTDAANKAQKAYEKTLAGKAEKAASKAKDWAEDRIDDLGDTARSVSKKASKTADKVKDWAEDRIDDAKEYVTGREAKKDLSKATQKREISKAGNMDLAVASNRGDTKHRVPGKKAKMESARKAYEEDKANEARAQKAYDKTLPGQIASGAKKVGNAAKKAGDAVSDAASDAKDWASKKVSDIGKTATKTVDAGKDFLEGLFGRKKKKKG